MLPLGKWKMNHHGRKRQFEIKSVDDSGRLDAAMEGVPVVGFWDEDAKRIMFQRPIKVDPAYHQGFMPIDGYILETFVGYLFDDDPDHPGTDTHYTIAGYFDYFGPAVHGATKRAQRMFLGWYAQIERAPKKASR